MKSLAKHKKDFEEVIKLITEARRNVLSTVNRELVLLKWKIGGYISQRVKTEKWGSGTVDQLAEYIKEKYPNLKGYTRRELFRMKLFYETYPDEQIVTTVASLISWSNNVEILSKTKSSEEREFYLQLALKEKYSKRELKRQIDSGYYERIILSKQKVSPLASQIGDHYDTFPDKYVLEFLDLPEDFSENELQKALLKNLRKFFLELGRDFTFVDEEYKLQVGKNDYYVDLLFYNRELQCLVALELKVDDFKPEYLGKLSFYLEALDRDVKKPHEKPSIGILLCKTKDDEVVEYALSRIHSPAMIAEYETKLIDKKLLRQKLHEFFELTDKD